MKKKKTDKVELYLDMCRLHGRLSNTVFDSVKCPTVRTDSVIICSKVMMYMLEDMTKSEQQKVYDVLGY